LIKLILYDRKPLISNQEDMILKIPEPCNVRPYNQRQMDLFPPSVRSLIPDDHLCIIVNDVVNAVDLS